MIERINGKLIKALYEDVVWEDWEYRPSPPVVLLDGEEEMRNWQERLSRYSAESILLLGKLLEYCQEEKGPVRGFSLWPGTLHPPAWDTLLISGYVYYGKEAPKIQKQQGFFLIRNEVYRFEALVCWPETVVLEETQLIVKTQEWAGEPSWAWIEDSGTGSINAYLEDILELQKL